MLFKVSVHLPYRRCGHSSLITERRSQMGGGGQAFAALAMRAIFSYRPI
jgi:hypothetical protein